MKKMKRDFPLVNENEKNEIEKSNRKYGDIK